MNNETRKDYGLIFWFHLVTNLAFIFSFILFSWWIIVIGEMLLQLQYILMKGCVLSKAEFGTDEACIPYYLHKWGFIENKRRVKIFVRYYLSIIVIALAIILQVVLKIQPLIY